MRVDSLSVLLKGLVDDQKLLSEDLKLTGISDDSRALKPGFLFFASKACFEDDCQYIEQSIASGAAFILYPDGIEPPDFLLEFPSMAVPNLEGLKGEIASRYYGDPSHHMSMIGVTGTNGKSSCVDYIAQILNFFQQKTAVMGTVGYGFLPALKSTSYTTPGAIVLQRQLQECYQEGAKAVAMEVSSHALSQQRTSGTVFDYALYTQLTHDHLDYHHNMQEYAREKQKLLELPGLKAVVINWDCPWGRLMADHIPGAAVVRYGFQSDDTKRNTPDVMVKSYQLDQTGITAQLQSPWGEGELRVPLLGRFNLYNVLGVITLLASYGLEWSSLLDAAAKLQPAKGRMQCFGGKASQPVFVVDYAHSPDALLQALQALRPHCHGRLWCVFGCGGERDQAKRPMMGRAAKRLADCVIVTSDNPRYESEQKIADQIVAGMADTDQVEVILDRAAAILSLEDKLGSDDIVLIAGKGHEIYQNIAGEQVAYSDFDTVEQCLRKMEKKID